MTDTRSTPTTNTGRSGARSAFSALIGVAAVFVLLQAVWAGLFIREGKDYDDTWVAIHSIGAAAALLLSVVALIVALVSLRSRRDLVTGTAAFVVALVLEGVLGGQIGEHPGLTVLHFPLAMAIMGLAVWLPVRATRGGRGSA